ncbi:salicylate 1-monooxygenase [Pseudomonas sp. CBSPBW29]|uniref:salicylate 1-monooxygenase n=1 Tax=Pseudomonas TaxID=286 RepID=UPI0021AD4A94|nr:MULTISPECIES: salicylate 1-monooxygenase [unclassified Pseudomonas]WEL44558.1 salicylate 1-monooxygenase [Pseudomonas sp. CBSPBW29]WEL65650.1 salicylate 1-monooxygenase [Pseudomonas sp. CBSPGW29]WEL69120.1 salicylate 1-monooxygenase [Pseudomonas sp. CBSPCGW29]WEL76117.1 salicylate 1-monooxygenase [Pseudomonas sp. CBSPAW29]WEL85313.1 salicylate 1-monooxygenase [Pseudomonas sp. CBSPCAW29]WEL88098.1 salicylate 1-monooxygenase [Pseudomonas sp. CBSPCBW29]
MTSPQSVLQLGIVGGGIAGVALALDLCRHKHLEVTLFEAAPAFGEVGAGVSFGANAVRAIEGLGIGKPYERIADRTPQPWQDIWFEWRRGADAGYLGASVAHGVGQSSVHRADFLDALAKQLPDGIARFDKRAVSAQETGDRVSVQFTDGTDYECDLLIVADGIKSNLRDYVLQGLGQPLVAPRFSGTCAYRGMIDSEQLRTAYRAAGIDEHLINVPQMYLGLDAHILTFPVKQGRLINVVAFVSDRSDPNPVWPPGTPWVKSTSQAQMLEAFAEWGDAVRVLLECIPDPTLWALHELGELAGYTHGRVGLIGDAAHAMLPHQGAGAGQGLEDAWLLARLLGDPRVLESNAQDVLQAYDAIRRPRACRVQRTSWEAGELYEFRDLQVEDREALLSTTLASRFDWLWNHDMQSDLADARARLGWAEAV